MLATAALTVLIVRTGGQCPRRPAAGDRVRRVVVSHPFDILGKPTKKFEVYELVRIINTACLPCNACTSVAREQLLHLYVLVHWLQTALATPACWF
jgi:hypothetical protein